MGYLTGEILLYLISVAMLGVLVGCLFTRSIYKGQVDEAEQGSLTKLLEANKTLAMKEEQLEQQQKKLIESETQLKKEQLRTSFSPNIDDRDLNLSDLKQQLEEKKQNIMLQQQFIDEQKLAQSQAEDDIEVHKEEKLQYQRELKAIKNRLTIFDHDLDDIVQRSGVLRAAFDHSRLELVDKDKRIAELEMASNDRHHDQTEVDEPLAISRIARLQDRVQELYLEVSKKDEEIERLQGNISDKKPEPGYTTISEIQRDDLKLIIGISPELEERLNHLGVTHFSEVAEWTPSEVKRFESTLGIENRIESEAWVKQAQKLNLPGGARIHRRW